VVSINAGPAGSDFAERVIARADLCGWIVDPDACASFFLVVPLCSRFSTSRPRARFCVARMARPLDYSKWDHIGDDDEELNEEAARHQPARPRVTKIESGRVNIHKDTVTELPPEDATERRTAAAAAAAAPSTADKAASLRQNGGVSKIGGYLWSQSAEEVKLSVPVPAATRGANVTVDLREKALSVRVTVGDARAAAPAGSLPTLEVSGALRHPIATDEETLTANWELVDAPASSLSELLPLLSHLLSAAKPALPAPAAPATGCRLVIVTLKKRLGAEGAPLKGLVLWWDSVFEAHEKIDTQNIAERTKGSTAATYARAVIAGHCRHPFPPSRAQHRGLLHTCTDAACVQVACVRRVLRLCVQPGAGGVQEAGAGDQEGRCGRRRFVACATCVNFRVDPSRCVAAHSAKPVAERPNTRSHRTVTLPRAASSRLGTCPENTEQPADGQRKLYRY
jgi:hypothetical protein